MGLVTARIFVAGSHVADYRGMRPRGGRWDWFVNGQGWRSAAIIHGAPIAGEASLPELHFVRHADIEIVAEAANVHGASVFTLPQTQFSL